jgi:hypothetical protein
MGLLARRPGDFESQAILDRWIEMQWCCGEIRERGARAHEPRRTRKNNFKKAIRTSGLFLS